MTDKPARQVVELPAGRALGVWEGGDPHGVPVVFHHGTPSGRLQAMQADEAARRQGVRLVSFDRPGYGLSTNTPPGLASVGVDTLAVADAVGIEEFAVLGVSGGGPYALAAGLADRARVRVVGLAAGVGPWRLIEPPTDDDPDLPLLALADAGDVEGALAGFRRQGGIAYGGMLALPDDALVDEFTRGAPVEDLAWLTPEAKRLWTADLRDALQTYDGYARDNVSWGAEWDIDPAQLTVPTRLWYGETDLLVPASHGRWFADRIPHSTLTVRPASGHGTTIFGYLEEMLSQVRG
jgi:pimeloyl-ACP methyl ester carboxylesterase